MADYSFDIAVIGGGAGGLFSASVARALGAKTVIVEKTRLGGDCTWFGCMPSKALLKSAQVFQSFKKAGDFGITVPQFPQAGPEIMARVRGIVDEIATHHEPEDLRQRGIEVIIGPPRFTGPQTLQVGEHTVTAKRFILCTGSHPVILPIEGLKETGYLTNETVFNLQTLPKSLMVLGGGPIGVELAQALNRLGVRVTLVEMMDRILFREDPDLTRFVEDRLRQEGMRLLTGRKAVKFSRGDKGVTAVLEDQQGGREEISAEQVLVAIGRAPNLDGLDLDKAGVAATKRGVTVNAFLQTSNPRIFACGDIASPYQFSHVAAYQAAACVRNAMFRRLAWQKVNYTNVAWATFTDPELAHLGLTEAEAKAQDPDARVYTTPYTNSDRAVTDRETEGLLKVIIDRKGKILGAHVVGVNAGEIIQGFLVAKSQGIPLAKLAQTLFIYPTLSELVKKTAAKPLIETGNNPLIKLLIKMMKAL